MGLQGVQGVTGGDKGYSGCYGITGGTRGYKGAAKPPLRIKHAEYRKLKSIDITKLKEDIRNSQLYQDPPNDLNMLLDCYNTTLKSLLDDHAPVCSRHVSTRPRTPWFNFIHKMVAITSKLAGDTVSPAVTEREPHGSSSGDDLVTLSEFQPLSEEAVRKKAVASRAAQT